MKHCVQVMVRCFYVCVCVFFGGEDLRGKMIVLATEMVKDY